MIYTFKELLDKLVAEHNDCYYYRGQNQLFPGPLWPSMYRHCALINTMQMPDTLHRRCNRGEFFGFRSNTLVGKIYENSDNIRLRELMRCMMGYVRNALGYCLSEAMFQQAGWNSEGLDVTSDVIIAFFFATHRYHEKKYYDDKSDCERIIYRWKIPYENWDLTKLNASGYYNCPALFPSERILSMFEECDTIQEFEQSIQDYRNAIGWGELGFDYSDIQGRRPYQIIKIPKIWKSDSRIIKQSASLLFPDSITSDEFNRHYSFNDENCQKVFSSGGSFVEDLSTACGCEKFLFKMQPEDFYYLDIDKERIYVKHDFSHEFLKGWMKSFHQNPYFVQNIMMPNDGTYLSQIDAKLNFDPIRYADNEQLFNG